MNTSAAQALVGSDFNDQLLECTFYRNSSNDAEALTRVAQDSISFAVEDESGRGRETQHSGGNRANELNHNVNIFNDLELMLMHNFHCKEITRVAKYH